ncbi:MAG: hypothetical protein JMDDDDMK_01476 [Acidobacteria bacterium]|nr:hypothetical protein [Acidobacteriota bacterium]
MKNRMTKRVTLSDHKAAFIAAALAAVLMTLGIMEVISPRPRPYTGRAAGTSEYLYQTFGHIGPALPLLGMGALFLFVAFAASRGWGQGPHPKSNKKSRKHSA